MEDSIKPEFAQSLLDIRLLQTAKLLEWMIANCSADREALACALGAVKDARSVAATWRP